MLQGWQHLINCRGERFNLQGKLLINFTQVLGTADDLKCTKQILILVQVVNHWARQEEKWTEKGGLRGSRVYIIYCEDSPWEESIHSMVFHLSLFTSHTNGVDCRVYSEVIHLLRDDKMLGVVPGKHQPLFSYLPKYHEFSFAQTIRCYSLVNMCSRESNSMQTWLMMTEVCCLGGCCWKGSIW